MFINYLDVKVVLIIEAPLPDHWLCLSDWVDSRLGAHFLGDVNAVLHRLQSRDNLRIKGVKFIWLKIAM